VAASIHVSTGRFGRSPGQSPDFLTAAPTSGAWAVAASIHVSTGRFGRSPGQSPD